MAQIRVKAKDVVVGDKMTNAPGPVTSIQSTYIRGLPQQGIMFANGKELVFFLSDDDVHLASRSVDAQFAAIAKAEGMSVDQIKRIIGRAKILGIFSETS